MHKENLDEHIEYVLGCRCLDEADLISLCRRLIPLLIEEPNVVSICSPVVICGDIHGQFFDLKTLLQKAGSPEDSTYIFLGDFVDRGRHSLECLTLLLLMKMRYPTRFFLLRGNHESRQITQVYGFYDECMQKYGAPDAWKACCDVFDHLNVAAVVDGRIFCVHGGLSPEFAHLDYLRTVHRVGEIPHEGVICVLDVIWSDPEELPNGGWSVSPRGAGFLFGSKVAAEFNHVNDLTLIARAHQLVQEGYKFMFSERSVVTIWSAPNYCYRCGNMASVMRIDSNHKFDESAFIIYDHTPEISNTNGKSNPYFD